MNKAEILVLIEQCHMELHNGTLTLDDFFERMCNLDEAWNSCDEVDDEREARPIPPRKFKDNRFKAS